MLWNLTFNLRSTIIQKVTDKIRIILSLDPLPKDKECKNKKKTKKKNGDAVQQIPELLKSHKALTAGLNDWNCNETLSNFLTLELDLEF